MNRTCFARRCCEDAGGQPVQRAWQSACRTRVQYLLPVISAAQAWGIYNVANLKTENENGLPPPRKYSALHTPAGPGVLGVGGLQKQRGDR